MGIANKSISEIVRGDRQEVKQIYVPIVLLLISLLAGCTSEETSTKSIPITELSDYKTIVSYEDGMLGNPLILRQGPKSQLFVYDAAKKQVLKFDSNGKVVNSFGGQGRGPGEFIMVNNMFLADNQLYVVDQVQMKISRFGLDGKLDGTFNFGKKRSHAVPPPAPRAKTPRAIDIDNQPVVTSKGNVLLSAIKPKGTTDSLYELVDWEDNHIASLGEVPKGSIFTLNYDQYQSRVKEGEIPAFYKAKAFAVNDQAKPDEVYLVYSDLANIAKYYLSGSKVWEKNIPKTAELDSLTSYYFESSQEMNGGMRIGLERYVAGITDEQGYLYLAVGKYHRGETPNSLWIHKFSPDGELLKRYHLKSLDTGLAPIFTIDVSVGRLYVVTENASIWSYAM